MADNMTDIGNGWRGRKTNQTRVAFHEDGSSVIYQDGALIAQAAGVAPAVLAFLFGDLVSVIAESDDLEHLPDDPQWAQSAAVAVAIGASVAESPQPKAQGDGWVSVKERMPAFGVPVLAYHPYWGIREGSLINGAVRGSWAGHEDATHWRPLPAPPEVP